MNLISPIRNFFSHFRLRSSVPCVIRANAVVTKSIPSGCVVAGVPARILRENINAHDIEKW